MEQLNVLYVEDQQNIKEKTVEALEFMSMKVVSVSNGVEALEQYKTNKPDIIITDIEVPKLNGLDLISKIRQHDNEIQIIILTECSDIKYCLKACELNLVKYLLQPVALKDLKEALVLCENNISYIKDTRDKYFNDKDYYSLIHKCLYVNEKVIRLDHHERNFLELLLKNHTRVVPYEELENKIWNNKMSSAAVRSLVRNLRKKLPKNAIENISKIGYKIVVEES